MRIYLLVLIALLTACGGGGGGSGDNSPTGSNDQGANNSGGQQSQPVSTTESKQAISYALATEYTSAVASMDSAQASGDASLAASGKYNSGSHLIQYEELFIQYLSVFLDSAKTDIFDIAAVYPTNANEVEAIILSYENEWEMMLSDDMSNHFSSFPTNAKDQITSEISASINQQFTNLRAYLIAASIL